MTGAIAILAVSPGFANADYLVSSDVAGIRVATIGEIPVAMHKQPLGDFCRDVVLEPKTVAGEASAQKGWYVTSEAALGRLTAVGIFSRSEDGTSSTCLIQDGNVAIFEGSKLKAIVYADLAQEGAAGPVGGVEETTQSGRVRISDWTPAGPTSDLTVTSGRLAIVPVATVDPACDGELQIPNVFGLPLKEARKRLAQYGWRPDRNLRRDSTLEPVSDRAADMRHAGLSEVNECSGTGWGFCDADYHHAGGATLGIVTIGDAPEQVSDYAVSCPKTSPTSKAKH